MTTTTPRAASARRRRLVPLTVFAAAAALGIVGHPAIASAEWDIDAYDKCIFFQRPAVVCCIESGGVWTGKNAGEGKCVAPAADPVTPPPRPGRPVPVGPPPTAINPAT